MATIVYWAHLPSLMKQVFIIQSAMPVMPMRHVVARLYGADSNYASVMVTETTLATMVVIPYSHAVDGLINKKSSSFH